MIETWIKRTSEDIVQDLEGVNLPDVIKKILCDRGVNSFDKCKKF
jgi:hypothetical protein